MKVLNDYKCENKECEANGIIVEKFNDDTVCFLCNKEMKRIYSSKQKFDLKGNGFYKPGIS